MSKFVDRVVLHATAGAGGNGCASVHREKYKPLGGPDGGNGGRGGSVVLVVDPGVHTLLDFHHRPHATARNGKQGQGGFKAGANADDLELAVPDGTVGLTPGASEGRGLGLDFLRHVERCSVLVHVVDCATLEPGRDPVSDVAALEEELARYTGALGGILTDRPRLVALNKVDVPDARDLAEMVRPELEERFGWPVFPISTATREGLRELTFAM